MEEIDTIIIESLKNLHCDFEEEVTSLKQFDADMTVNAISRCLEAINPETTYPKKLPPSMSIKLKIATNLAEQIKDLGFRDDIGYQSVLYCNEVEIRRVLMFLIERLPREQKVTHVEQTGYVPSLIKEMEQKVKSSLQQFWVPSCVLHDGCRRGESGVIVHSFGNSRPLRTQKLEVPNSKNNSDGQISCVSVSLFVALKQYWIHNVPVVTKQCSGRELLPSLLFQDCLISNDLKKCFKMSPHRKEEIHSQILLEATLVPKESQVLTEKNIQSETEIKLQSLLTQLEEKKQECLELEKTLKSCDVQLEQATKTKTEYEETLQKTEAQVVLKTKTLSVLSKEENKEKLKNMIEAEKSKLLKLAEQWNNVQKPLLEEYKSLQSDISDEDLRKQQEHEKLRKLEETQKSLIVDLQDKTQLEDQLRKKLEQVNKNQSRSGYTRRILEIIANIKKQDEEIQKILKDTREVQREISILTGQVDRSFTLADEMIFRDAKSDEVARKAYKLLAQLRDDCSSIIKAVTDLGLVERECRNLQDQIDIETAKENAVKLERVNKDLQEIRKETEILIKQQKT